MPPSPRNSPALEVARPGDTTRRDTGWHRDESESGWEFLFGDRQWHPVDVRAWWVDDRGRDVVQIYWTAELSTWGGTYLANPEKMREGLGGEPGHPHELKYSRLMLKMMAGVRWRYIPNSPSGPSPEYPSDVLQARHRKPLKSPVA